MGGLYIVMQQLLKKLGFDLLEHLAYGPDLAPSVCLFFGLLSHALQGC